MKKAILIVTLFYFFSILGVGLNAAFGADQADVIFKTIRIDKELRTVAIFADKNGEKVFDSYKENDRD